MIKRPPSSEYPRSLGEKLFIAPESDLEQYYVEFISMMLEETGSPTDIRDLSHEQQDELLSRLATMMAAMEDGYADNEV
ncbi:osmolarity sensor protein [Roseibium sp. TrichSKD4]|uniref:hypothetical protein n=1 Tax=Roseibium sp. TrichSKD4 TaxID=744980 RepID=UPI0001E57556|nr:hypothetical protein [Roseibium sp. TrichSKD4]EFO29374.1 osmolarity sensor protein [Roseibium sp. TrichSKD4]